MSLCIKLILVTISSRSVPEKRKQHHYLHGHSSERGHLEHRAAVTPIKQLPFFSPTRGPPSPHHKPRASSPLRSSDTSPTVIINRPAQRRPFGQLKVTVLGTRNTLPQRITSKDFKFYEDDSPLKTPTICSRLPSSSSPNKSNDKENVDPFGELTEQRTNADPFVRPQPRGPLSKMKRWSQASESSSFVASERVVAVETITTEDFSGTKIVHEVQKKIEAEILKRSGFENTQSISRMPANDNWGFEIYYDNAEDENMADQFGNQIENIIIEDGGDKENQDPGLGRSTDEMHREGMVVPRTGKRKHSEDFV